MSYINNLLNNSKIRFIFIKNRLNREEIREVLRIIKDIHSNYKLSQMDSFREAGLNDIKMIEELCSIKDKRFFKIIKPYVIGQLATIYKFTLTPDELIGFIKALVDYNRFGDGVYSYSSSILWYDCYSQPQTAYPLENKIRVSLYKTAKNLDKDFYGKDFSPFLYFRAIYYTYLYMNQDKLDVLALMNWFDVKVDEEYYQHLLLNGALNDENEFNKELKMFFIKEIIDSYNKSTLKGANCITK
ncbi:MAG: hypothetical protein J6X02_04390 [Bacilli bacterium]|nr:hypothetical protein [Bacilli bacterium]